MTIFKFDENGKVFSKKGRKHCGKRRNCSLRAISPFPTVFSKDLYYRYVKKGFAWEIFKNMLYLLTLFGKYSSC